MTLQEILDQLPKIKSNRNYWLVRTNGGEYYEDFVSGNFIAIGWDSINISDIEKGNTEDATGYTILRENVIKKYPEEGRPGHAANQLLKFAFEIKKNDIVLIPSKNSDFIKFGEVEETLIYSQIDQIDGCPFIKRKKVKWLNEVRRNRLDPHLFKLMFSHLTISDANNYSEQIDKELNSFFIKSDKAHLILDVQSEKEIAARTLFEVGLLPLEIFDDFCKEEDLDIDSSKFRVKLDVQSPGFIEISGIDLSGIVILALIIIGIAGGGFKLKYKDDLSVGIKTDGIIEKLRRFLSTNSKIQTNKKIIEKHLDELQIKEPEELIEILKNLEKKK